MWEVDDIFTKKDVAIKDPSDAIEKGSFLMRPEEQSCMEILKPLLCLSNL